MTRVFKDWLPAFLDYAAVTEAPRLMHFWAGVAAVSSCLRRKVWIDQRRFQWTPNFYIIFVAPPGIVSKSTTADIAMDLVKSVLGINFGPDIITWPSLVTAFEEVTEAFQYGEDWHSMSALTLVASELGNLINPQDRDMINLYINLWDGRKSLEKRTKGNGSDSVAAPWVSLIGCTTPHWIADNMPSATVGGGFTSRCVFVYADKKDKFVPYIDEVVSTTDDKHREALIHDLEHMSINLCGPYTISGDARIWGRAWYEQVWSVRPKGLEDERMDGYIARKQTHLHKLAMVLAAAQRDELVITAEDLAIADRMLSETEVGLSKVFAKIGQSDASQHAERLISHMRLIGQCPYEDAYLYIHSQFPDFRDYEGILNGAIRAGILGMGVVGGRTYLKYAGKDAIPTNTLSHHNVNTQPISVDTLVP